MPNSQNLKGGKLGLDGRPIGLWVDGGLGSLYHSKRNREGSRLGMRQLERSTWGGLPRPTLFNLLCARARIRWSWRSPSEGLPALIANFVPRPDWEVKYRIGMPSGY